MRDRYNVSILIALLFVRELVGKIREEKKRGGWIGGNGGGGNGGRKGGKGNGHIIANIINPGVIYTAITRHATGAMKQIFQGVMTLMARWTEEGARTLVLTAEGGEETHGEYLDDGKAAGEVCIQLFYFLCFLKRRKEGGSGGWVEDIWR